MHLRVIDAPANHRNAEDQPQQGDKDKDTKDGHIPAMYQKIRNRDQHIRDPGQTLHLIEEALELGQDKGHDEDDHRHA